MDEKNIRTFLWDLQRMKNEYKNILALAAHTDDVEIGCGATLYKLKESNDVNIKVLAFSLAPGDKNTVTDEFSKSMEMMNADYELYDIPIRYLSDNRQVVLDALYKESKQNQYDIVFCPNSFDTHQDHEVVNRECFRAFKKTSILGFEMPWNVRTFNYDLFVEVSEQNLNSKVSHFECYQTQLHRPYFTKDYVFTSAKYRGYQSGKKYAEAFEVIRMVM